MAEGRNISSRRIRNIIAHDATLFVAKVSAQALNGGKVLVSGGSGGIFSKAAQYLAGAQAAMSESIGNIIGLGAMGAICAAISQMDYRYALDEIKSLYRDEVAAKLGKSADGVTIKDLETLAKGDPEHGIEHNQVLADILDKQRKHRTLGVVMSIVASIATFSILHLAMAATGAHAVGAAAMIAEGLIGVATYKAIKTPLEWISHHRLGLHHQTTHERICDLQRAHDDGKVISQEQVLDVFVSANKGLQEMIVADYGAPLHSLPLEKRAQAIADIDAMVPLKELTENINNGSYKIAELAFAVEGQVSGANHQRTEEKIGLLEGLINKLRNKKQEIDTLTHQDIAPVMHETKPSFTERLKFGKADTHLGHVERLNQERAAQNNALAQR